MATASPPARRTPTALRVLAVPLTAAVLIAGGVLVVGPAAPGQRVGQDRAHHRLVRGRGRGAAPHRRGRVTSTSCTPFRYRGDPRRGPAGGLVRAELPRQGGPGAARDGADDPGRARNPSPPAGLAAPEDTAPEATARPGPQLLGRGRLRGIDHTASGTAELVDTGSKVVVQLRDFDVQPGPDYRLYLADGESPDGGRELGRAQGHVGQPALRRRAPRRRATLQDRPDLVPRVLGARRGGHAALTAILSRVSARRIDRTRQRRARRLVRVGRRRPRGGAEPHRDGGGDGGAVRRAHRAGVAAARRAPEEHRALRRRRCT